MRSAHNPCNLPCYFHGRDSWFGQRKHDTLGIQCVHIQCVHGLVDRPVEFVSISEGLMCEMMRLEVVPHDLDVVQFGRILGQPLDGEPVRPGGKRRQGSLLVWIGPLSSTNTTGLAG